MVEFGELVTVSPRQAWRHEEHHFTPWLAQQENLDKLSEETGLPWLELVEREKREGSLRADIIARDVDDDRVVLIENQLGWADFDHLGRTLAYANAFNADIVVWIAEDFAPDPLSAFRWLNEHTTEGVHFFAIRVRVFRIGDSLMAPKFEVLEHPDNFVRGTRPRWESRDLSEIQQFRRDFWEFYNKTHPGDLPRWYPGYRNRHSYINIGGLVVGLAASQVEVGHYLSDARSSKDPEVRRRYNYVVGRFPERWDRRPFDYCQNPENWGEMAQWLHDALERYRELIAESAAVVADDPEPTAAES